jgi:YolD-like protein.
MTNTDRAKQFAPYAALKGFGDYIRAAERETVERVILGEDAAGELNRRLQDIRTGDTISATYYRDGQYVEVRGRVRRISMEEHALLVGSVRVPFADILSIRKGEDTA